MGSDLRYPILGSETTKYTKHTKDGIFPADGADTRG